MIAITLIYMFAIALFNLSDWVCVTSYSEDFYDLPLCQRYWTTHFYFFTFAALSYAYYYIRSREVVKVKRAVYLVACIFSSLYTIYQVSLLTSKDIAIFLGRINNWIWESVFVILVVGSFAYVLYSIFRKQ